jgi:hypothetical protein
MNQRWSYGRGSYRHDGEPIDPADYDVCPLAGDALARAFVVEHHYSGSYPAARWRFGLYWRGLLVGVAVFSHPASDQVLTRVFEIERATDAVELGRFVLAPEVPGNGETWFLARCLRALKREGLAGVVSFSDPMKRTTARGVTVFGGHYGCIYQAGSALYLGRGRARTLRLLPDGSVLSERALSKIRNSEQGVDYAVGQLVRHGASPPGGDLGGWLAHWLPRLTRPVRHKGSLRYAFPLGRVRVLLPEQDYPKPPDLKELR